MRLNRFLASAGAASRRGADKLIASGRVTVNGHPCTEFNFQPEPSDHVKVDGKPVRQQTPTFLILHKPAGFVCTRRDPHVTDTIYDLLPAKFSSLFYVGRLDAPSEGLVLLTNDGEFAHRVTHPRHQLTKEYVVTLDRPATPDLPEALQNGVFLDGKWARASEVRQIAPMKLRIILGQGVNRQIRRMLEHYGFRAKRLVRVRVGGIHLGDLPRGHWQELSQREADSAFTRLQAGGNAPDLRLVRPRTNVRRALRKAQ
ncbi:MAG: pseudouridine synthase [Verrucomicrobiota bacterium]